MSKRTIIVFVLATLLVFLGVKFVVHGNDATEKPATNRFSSGEHSISFDYPKQASTTELTTRDKKDGYILRLNGEDETPYLVTLRYEDGLATGAKLAKVSTLDLMLDTLDKSFPKVYQGFNKKSEEKYEHQGRSAARIEFSYSSPEAKEPVFQILHLFLRDENTAYYLSMQGKEVDGNELKPIFKAMADSFRYQGQ